MRRFRTVARFLSNHWFLVVAVVVNLAIAAPIGAVNWDNDVCRTEDGEAFEECCTTCWFFCTCDIGEGGDDGGGGDSN